MKLEEWGSLILSWANFLDINEEISSLEELSRSDLFSRLLRVLTKLEKDNVHQNDFLDYLREQYPAIDFGNKQSRCRDDTILCATVFLIYCSLHHEGNDLRQKMTELPHWTQLCLSDFLQELVEVSQSSITRDLIFSEISKISSSRIPESIKQTPQFGTPVIYSSTPTEEMRWLVRLAVFVCVFVLVLSRPPQSRPRATRGFKNVALSTARGFGKRDDESTVPRLRAEWLANEIVENPELAELFVRRFLDADADGYLSADELLLRPTLH